MRSFLEIGENALENMPLKAARILGEKKEKKKQDSLVSCELAGNNNTGGNSE